MSRENLDQPSAGLEASNRTGEPPTDFVARDFERHQASSIVDTAAVFHGPEALRDFLLELRGSFEELGVKFIDVYWTLGAPASRPRRSRCVRGERLSGGCGTRSLSLAAVVNKDTVRQFVDEAVNGGATMSSTRCSRRK
jgi:hypothetical protein